jgi:hypothetical protein
VARDYTCNNVVRYVLPWVAVNSVVYMCAWSTCIPRIEKNSEVTDLSLLTEAIDGSSPLLRVVSEEYASITLDDIRDLSIYRYQMIVMNRWDEEDIF